MLAKVFFIISKLQVFKYVVSARSKDFLAVNSKIRITTRCLLQWRLDQLCFYKTWDEVKIKSHYKFYYQPLKNIYVS